MLVRDFRRLALFAGPILLAVYLTLSICRRHEAVRSWLEPALRKTYMDDPGVIQAQEPLENVDAMPLGEALPMPTPSPVFPGDDGFLPTEHDVALTHHEVFSSSTADRQFFKIDFGQREGINPNVVPHPTLPETWLVVAQEAKTDQTIPFVELACNAGFRDGALRCLHPPTALPIAPTAGGLCKGELGYFNLNVGPHDARVFWGPEAPYVVYGSNSQATCFGQWVQDLRALTDWGDDALQMSMFATGTELQRPPPWSVVEKNWFLFWDLEGHMYAHFDIMPRRVFARIEPDGSAGEDLAPASAAADEACMARYMPRLAPELESIHQATNALKVTLCRRADAGCRPDASNTFVVTLFQHKTFYNFHGVYEPYVMVFEQRAPFAVHAISRQPLWIHGRRVYPERETSDMLYVTSISWRDRGQREHGFLDDVVVLGFGVEDTSAAGLDVVAAELLGNLGLCND